MDGDSRFWIAFTAIICITFIGVIGFVTFGIKYTNEKYYETYNTCIEHNGIFVPQSPSTGVCVIK